MIFVYNQAKDYKPCFVDRNGRHVPYAAAIKTVREGLGLGQAQLAREIGVSRRTIEGWEQGRVPSLDGLMKLYRYLATRARRIRAL